MRWSLAVLWYAWVLMAGGVGAQAVGDSGGGDPRLVRVFDFEAVDPNGRKIGHALTWPEHWYPVGRDPLEADPAFLNQPLHQVLRRSAGYPSYNPIGFDGGHAVSGEFSLRLSLRGGNAGAFVEVGALPAMPGSDYELTLRVRTDELTRAGARVEAYLLDGQGRIIEDSRQSVRGVRTHGQWRPVVLRLTGRHPEAAWIGLQVELEQPQRQAQHPLGAEQVVLEDVVGTAWFDDIALWQLPNVRLGMAGGVNVSRGGLPTLEMAVRDLTGQQLRARAVAYDMDHREVAREERPVGRGAPTDWQWTPQLGAYGWYVVRLEVLQVLSDGETEPVGQSVAGVLWLPEAGSEHDRDADRFWLLADGPEDLSVDRLPELVRRTGLPRVMLSVWQAQTTAATLRHRLERVERLLGELGQAGARAGLSLEPLPAELAYDPAVEPGDAAGLLAARPDVWRVHLRPVLMRLGQRVSHWSMGTSAGDELADRRELSGALREGRALLEATVAQPVMMTPWPVHRGLPADWPTHPMQRLVQVWPGVTVEAMSEQLGLSAAGGASASAGDLIVELVPASAQRLDHGQRSADLAERMVLLWAQDVAGLAVRTPWSAPTGERDALDPDPLLGVWVNVAERLSGRRLVGRLPLTEGLVGLVFDGDDGGVLAAWNRSASSGGGELVGYLGPSVRVVDVWGNARAVEPVDGEHRVQLTRSPVFIEGIDVELLRMRSAFVVNEPELASLQTAHQREVTLHNPWSVTATGTLDFVGPGGWTIQPYRHHFAIPPGESVVLPLTMRFPVLATAGEHELVARLRFRADQPYDVLVSTPLRLGLPDIEFTATATLQPAADGQPGRDLLVTCVISNSSNEPRSLYAFASHHGQPRQERLVPTLGPGQTIVRRFRFRQLDEASASHPVRCGVRESSGPAILNQIIDPRGG
jgi:hypothetical protein